MNQDEMGALRPQFFHLWGLEGSLGNPFGLLRGFYGLCGLVGDSSGSSGQNNVAGFARLKGEGVYGCHTNTHTQHTAPGVSFLFSGAAEGGVPPPASAGVCIDWIVFLVR
jgi:hypothetical protein